MSFRVTANVVELFFFSFLFFFWYRARHLARFHVSNFGRDQKKFLFFFLSPIIHTVGRYRNILRFGNRDNNRDEEFPLTRLITTGIDIFIFFYYYPFNEED